MKKVLVMQKGILLSLFAVFGLFLSGCQIDSDGNITISEGTASNPVTVFGTVIDQETRQGIGKAKVYIKVFGEWRSTETVSSQVIGEVGGAGDSTTGDFRFDNLPVDTDDIPILVKSPEGSTVAYLQLTGTFDTSDFSSGSDGVNSRISHDLGQIEMEQGVTATVRVVDGTTGSYVVMDKDSDSSTVEAIPIYNGFGIGSFVSIEDEIATQDSTDSDKYTIVIPQTGSSTLTVPSLDVDGDGLYDYTGGTATISASGPGAGVVTGVGTLETNIVLATVGSGTTLSALASNVNEPGANSGGTTTLNMIAKADPIKVYFNLPIVLPTTGEDALTLTYPDSFKSLNAAAVTAEVTVTAAVASPLLTVTPAADLVEGQSYTLNGSIRSNLNSPNTAVDEVYSLGTLVAGLLGSNIITVTQTGTGTIGSTPVVSVDNFNHWTNNTEIVTSEPLTQTPEDPWVVFPEPVWGDVRLISQTTGTATTTSNTAPVALTGQGVAWWVVARSDDPNTTNNNTGANRGGALYRFDLDAAFAVGTESDHNSTTTNSFLLGINGYDADGNLIQTENSYNVE